MRVHYFKVNAQYFKEMKSVRGSAKWNERQKAVLNNGVSEFQKKNLLLVLYCWNLSERGNWHLDENSSFCEVDRRFCNILRQVCYVYKKVVNCAKISVKFTENLFPVRNETIANQLYCYIEFIVSQKMLCCFSFLLNISRILETVARELCDAHSYCHLKVLDDLSWSCNNVSIAFSHVWWHVPTRRSLPTLSCFCSFVRVRKILRDTQALPLPSPILQ